MLHGCGRRDDRQDLGTSTGLPVEMGVLSLETNHRQAVGALKPVVLSGIGGGVFRKEACRLRIGVSSAVTYRRFCQDVGGKPACGECVGEEGGGNRERNRR
jgi:hypothetical protein